MQLPLHVVSGQEAEHEAEAPLATQNKPAPHAVPHAPQLAVSVVRLTHLPPQLVSPAPHTQLLAEHCCPLPHAFPHAPQLLGSLLVATQLLPHSDCPCAHSTPPPEGGDELELQANGNETAKKQPTKALTMRFMREP